MRPKVGIKNRVGNGFTKSWNRQVPGVDPKTDRPIKGKIKTLINLGLLRLVGQLPCQIIPYCSLSIAEGDTEWEDLTNNA